MAKKKLKILVITPINHIKGLYEEICGLGDVYLFQDPKFNDIKTILADMDAIFTNPNKSKIYLDDKVFQLAPKLKVICTASTGTNHIDLFSSKERNIEVLSLTKEYEVINKISSTAELAFTLTMAGIRKIIPAFTSVLNGEWDYEKFIGRQIGGLTIGVIGYGRLGKMYANYCASFGAEVLIYDPFINEIDILHANKVDLENLLEKSDVISIHIHATESNKNFLNQNLFKKMKKNVLIINTSRGDVINEEDLIDFLQNFPSAAAYVDVLADEIRSKHNSPLYKMSKEGNDQIVITPHIGGMTIEGQEIAYMHAAKLLKNYFAENN